MDAGQGGGLVLVLVATRFLWSVMLPHGMTSPGRGQAQGPHIHPTSPLVPTGRSGRLRPDTHDYPIRLEKFIRDAVLPANKLV